MWYLVALLVAVTVTVCMTMPMAVEPMWKDCGKSENRSLFLTYFNVTPHPVELPGKIQVTMHSENRHEIRHMKLNLSIKRHIWMDYYLEIPCTNNYGSCIYDNLCEYLANPPEEAQEPMLQVKKIFLNAGHTLECPLQPAELNVNNVQHELPELPPLVAMIAAGKYKLRAEFTDPTEDDREIGCFELIVEAKEWVDPDAEYEAEIDDDCFFFC